MGRALFAKERARQRCADDDRQPSLLQLATPRQTLQHGIGEIVEGSWSRKCAVADGFMSAHELGGVDGKTADVHVGSGRRGPIDVSDGKLE